MEGVEIERVEETQLKKNQTLFLLLINCLQKKRSKKA